MTSVAHPPKWNPIGPDPASDPRAVCRNYDSETWFATGREETAKLLCSACELVSGCRDWALANRIEYGVWGGLDEKERRALLKRKAGR